MIRDYTIYAAGFANAVFDITMPFIKWFIAVVVVTSILFVMVVAAMLCSCAGKTVRVTDQKTGTTIELGDDGVVLSGTMEFDGVTVEIEEEKGMFDFSEESKQTDDELLNN